MSGGLRRAGRPLLQARLVAALGVRGGNVATLELQGRRLLRVGGWVRVD